MNIREDYGVKKKVNRLSLTRRNKARDSATGAVDTNNVFKKRDTHILTDNTNLLSSSPSVKGSLSSGFMDVSSQDDDNFSHRSFMAKENNKPTRKNYTQGESDLLEGGQKISSYEISPGISNVCEGLNLHKEFVLKDSGSESLFGSGQSAPVIALTGSESLSVSNISEEKNTVARRDEVRQGKDVKPEKMSGKNKKKKKAKQGNKLSIPKKYSLVDFTDSEEDNSPEARKKHSENVNVTDHSIRGARPKQIMHDTMRSLADFTDSDSGSNERAVARPMRTDNPSTQLTSKKNPKKKNVRKKLAIVNDPEETSSIIPKPTETIPTQFTSKKNSKKKQIRKQSTIQEKMGLLGDFTDSDDAKKAPAIAKPTAKITTQSTSKHDSKKLQGKKKLTDLVLLSSSEEEKDSASAISLGVGSIDVLSQQLDDILFTTKNRKKRSQKREMSIGQKDSSADSSGWSQGMASSSDISVLSQQLDDLLFKSSKRMDKKKGTTSLSLAKKNKTGGKNNTLKKKSEIVFIPDSQPDHVANDPYPCTVTESASMSPASHTRLVGDSTEVNSKLFVSDSASNNSTKMKKSNFFKSILEDPSDSGEDGPLGHQARLVPNSADNSFNLSGCGQDDYQNIHIDTVPDSQPRRSQQKDLSHDDGTPHLPHHKRHKLKSPQVMDLHLKVTMSPGSTRKHNNPPIIVTTPPSARSVTRQNLTMRSPENSPYLCNISLQVSLPTSDSLSTSNNSSPQSPTEKVKLYHDNSTSMSPRAGNSSFHEKKDVSMQVSFASPDGECVDSPSSNGGNSLCLEEDKSPEGAPSARNLLEPLLPEEVPASPVWTMLKNIRDGIGRVVRSSEKTARGKLSFENARGTVADDRNDEENMSLNSEQPLEMGNISGDDDSVCIPHTCIGQANLSKDIEIIYPVQPEEVNNNKDTTIHDKSTEIDVSIPDIEKSAGKRNKKYFSVSQELLSSSEKSSDYEMHSEPDAFKTCLDLSVEESSDDEPNYRPSRIKGRKVLPKPDLPSYDSGDSSDGDNFENFLGKLKKTEKSHSDKKKQWEKSLDSFIASSSEESDHEDSVFYIRRDQEDKNKKTEQITKKKAPFPQDIFSSSEDDAECDNEVEEENNPSTPMSPAEARGFVTPANPIVKPRSWTTRPVTNKGIGEHYHGDRVDTIATPFRTPVDLQCGRPTSPKDPACYSFLKSLSCSVTDATKHPDCIRFIRNFKKTKEDLCAKLFRLFNQTVFENQLPADLNIKWNARLLKTAGFCAYRRQSSQPGVARTARIELSIKVCDSPERVRDTLIHELCHAAVWLIHGVNGGHGPHWKFWAKKASRIHPDLPSIARCHSYAINYKFIYRCTSCGYQVGRHSKSLKTDSKICGHCRSPFELLQNTAKGLTTTPNTTPNKFALFVKKNYGSIRKPGISHQDVMRTLSADFAKTKLGT